MNSIVVERQVLETLAKNIFPAVDINSKFSEEATVYSVYSKIKN